MFTLYSQVGNSWVYMGTFASASNALGRCRELQAQGYTVVLEDKLTSEVIGD